MAEIGIFFAIMAETISVCSRSCWFCKFGQRRYLDEPHTQTLMTWETIETIVDQLVDLKYQNRVSWQRINEPLLDRRLPQIIALTKERLPSCHQSIVTNGDLLSQSKYDELIQSGLDHITISAYDDVTLQKMEELHMSNFNIKDRRDPNFGWDNRGGNIIQFAEQQIDGYCERPYTGLNVLVNGDIVLCCCDFYGDVTIGNVHQQHIADIWWHNSVLNRYREHLKSTRKGLLLCESCSHPGGGHGIRGNYSQPHL